MSTRAQRRPAWKVVRRAMASIWIVGPGMLGTLSLGLGGAIYGAVGQGGVGDIGELMLAAGSGLLAFAVAATGVRTCWRRGEIVATMQGDGETYPLRQAVDRVAIQARRAGDGEAADAADRLSLALNRLRDLPDDTDDPRLPPAMRGRIAELWDHCLAGVSRLVELRRAAAEVATEAATRRVLADHEALAGDVRTALDRLEASLDHARLASLSRDKSGEEMTELAASLDRGLEVARRVDERMEALEAREKAR